MTGENGASDNIPDQWTKEELMGGTKKAEAPAPVETKGRRSSVRDLGKADPLLWGLPGHLTEEEADTYVSRLSTLFDNEVLGNGV